MITMNESLKAIHDKMLEEKPESAAHDAADCPFCTPQNPNPTGGNMSDTFTKEDVAAQVSAAVAEATKALTEELETFKASQSAAEVEARIAAVQAEADEKLASLQADLDAKVIELEASTSAHGELVALLEAEEARITEEAEAASRKDERVAKVEAVASFPEEYVTENADRWASMSDEVFEATLAGYAEVAEKASADASKGKVPAKTALHASRDEDGKGSTAVRELSSLRRQGFDPRNIVH